MTRTLDQIEDEVLQLPEDSRARLMERLLSSFGRPDGQDDIAQAWVDEAERRDREMSVGEDDGTPAREVFRRLRSSLR